LKLEIVKDQREVSVRATEYITTLIKEKSNAVLGLSTGSTPIGVYQELIGKYQKGEINFSDITTFNLDEYYGLPASHPQSYHSFMRKVLFDHINMKEENIYIPFGRPNDIFQYCKEYEQKIEAIGGIDIQLLGIGRNGHIGFNEPAQELQSDTHLVQLAEDTIQANSRFFESREDVPKYAITMGIKTIFKAKKVLLLAIGEEKKEIIKHLLESGITTDLPASLLKLHPDVTVLVDQRAAQEISVVDN
jgi:glucosamine-6-phosphate deaminase